MRFPTLKSRILQRDLLAYLVLAIAVGGTIIVYQFAKHYEHHRILNAFQELATLKAQRIYLRVDGYERALADLRGLFVATETVTETEFKRYLDGVEVSHRYPELFRIGYAPLVTEANRAVLETQLESKGLAHFRAAPDHVPYFPILYGYPTADEALGANLHADPLRSEALDAARDRNQPRISPWLTFRLASDPQRGLMLCLPLYAHGVSPSTIQQRRQALAGYVYAAFRTEDLINSTIGPDFERQMHFALVDGNTVDPGNLAYDSNHTLQMVENDPQEIYSIQRLQVSGHPWTLLFVARPQFILAHQSKLPMAVLIGGLLASALAAWLANAATKRLLAERRIRYLAFHDELTGLPNRAALRNLLSAAITRGQQTDTTLALLIVELRHFREINYTLGHVVGDELLKQVSSRLRQAAATHTTVARISAIEFGVLLPNAAAVEAVAFAERLLKCLEEPLPAGEINYELGAQVGIAFFPDHGTDIDDLIRHADIARNQASKTARDYVVYSAARDPYKPRRLALLGDFRKAIKEYQLQLYVQPKANLRTGEITSGEALVRWQHPTYGLLLPEQFIPLIEPTELIQLLTERMLEAAFQQYHIWRESDLVLPLAVNLSTRNLLHPDLPDIILGLMRAWGAEPAWVDLEVTESGIMLDPALSLRVLNQLHVMGFRLFVDDFGTGYSSLSYLMQLPIDMLKIDKSFIMNMVRDADAAVIVKSTIEMAHSMGMKVVAEGTASEETWEALKRLHCDEAQGHYISPPLPAEDVIGWLKRSSWAHSLSHERLSERGRP